MTPFIVYAMPRSRSYWLSRFLTYSDWVCGHDEARHVRSLNDVKAWFSQPCTGTVETAAAPFWRVIPDVKTLVLRRDPQSVVSSLVRFGFDRKQMWDLVERVDAKLDQIEARIPNVLSVHFDDLSTLDGCRMVFEHCLPYELDERWWQLCSATNMQTSMIGTLRYMQANRPQLERAAREAKNATLAHFKRKNPTEIDGMTFQQESWDKFYADGKPLFEANSTVAGSGTTYDAKNVGLMRMMAQSGSLQVTTARCNGRMFGYVIMAVSPSMESAEETSALHIMSYVSPDAPGIGLKMTHAAEDALRDRGVDEIRFRVGEEQKKLGAFYRRLGAVYAGEEYILRLN